MDITLLKTFLEVAATGSFVSASERLYVTQSAVSLRIQRLEDSLGKPMFTRSKAGAELTNAGREFERYALSMIRVWEEARQQVAIPEGFTRSLTIGAQYSLWPRLGFRWIDRLQAAAPDLNNGNRSIEFDGHHVFVVESADEAMVEPRKRGGRPIGIRDRREDRIAAIVDRRYGVEGGSEEDRFAGRGRPFDRQPFVDGEGPIFRQRPSDEFHRVEIADLLHRLAEDESEPAILVGGE